MLPGGWRATLAINAERLMLSQRGGGGGNFGRVGRGRFQQMPVAAVSGAHTANLGDHICASRDVDDQR